MLADRDRGTLAGFEFRAYHLQGRARERDMISVARGALDHIAGADEARHEFRLRPVIDILGRTELIDFSGIHHRDQVGGGHRLGLVVGDVDRGVTVFVVQPADFKTHLFAQIGVEIGQGFVEQ